MIQVTFSFDSPDAAKAFLAGLGKKAKDALPEISSDYPAAGAVAADPMAGVAPQASPMAAPAPAAETAPATPAPAAAAPQQAEQKDVIAAFTDLGKAKGRDAIAAIIAQYGVKTVLDIPQDQWGDVVTSIRAQLA